MIHLETALDIPFDLSLLEQAARAALDHQSADGDLTLVLADDEQLRRLNRDYRGVDAPTDVLSFPASETDPETGAPYLGDILLSVSRAAEQARSAGHPSRTRRACWSSTASCTCSATITPKRMRKPKCGRRRRRYWKASG